MSKFFGLLFSGVIFAATPSLAQEAEVVVPEDNVAIEDIVRYGYDRPLYVPKLKELTPEEDDLYDGGEIKPLRATLSETEKMQKGGGFEDEDKSRLPELLCSDEKLRTQVGKFIFDYMNKQPKNTVPGRRSQVLLIRNMKVFQEVQDTDLKKNFEASSALMHLRMNENREIYKICASRDNDNKNFRDLNIIIYPFMDYYKVVVTNLISTPENMEEATFIYSW